MISKLTKHVPNIDKDINLETGDTYVGAEVSLPHGDSQQTGKVICWARDLDGELTGTAHNNPTLDTCSYQVEFPDGQLGKYSTNVIAQNMLSQCDLDGNQFILMESIVDHKVTNEALLKPLKMHVTIKGKQHQRKTTKGSLICVECRDRSTSWRKLSSPKDSYPVELAEYLVAQGIDHQPAFCWWVPQVLHKKDHIIAAVNKCYHNRTHKFGFEVPKTVKHTVEIDHENGNSLWQDAIALEMEAVHVAFKVMNEGEEPPPAYQYMECHFMFDIKLDSFQRKAHLIARGHITETLAVLTYMRVVSRDSVCVALTIAALNDLQVKASDVQNA